MFCVRGGRVAEQLLEVLAATAMLRRNTSSRFRLEAVSKQGKPAMNSIRSSCVIWLSIPGNHRGLPVTHQPPATMALGGGGKRSVL